MIKIGQMKTELRYLKYIFITVLTALLSLEVFASSKEYFGEFIGELNLQWQSNSKSRQKAKLLDVFKFRDPNGFVWSTPEGWVVDGATIPKPVWSFFGGPFSGNYVASSVIHDYYCFSKERTAHDTHRSFYNGMRASGVSVIKAKLMYWAVSAFGPSWKIVRKPVLSIKIEPTAYKLIREHVEAPTISDDEAIQLIKKTQKLLEKTNSSLSLSQLDALSDEVRIKYGSEELQKELPTISSTKSNSIKNINPYDGIRKVFIWPDSKKEN